MPYLARRAGELAARYARPDKAARLLGWQATRSLQDMCCDTWHWQTRGVGFDNRVLSPIGPLETRSAASEHMGNSS